MKKITKILGIFFAVLTALSMFFPIYKTTFTDGESMTLLLHGYDLYEFSGWGVLAMMVPILIIGIMFAKFDDKIRSALIMSMFVLGNVSVQNAKIAMQEWVYSEATEMVYSYGGLIFYSFLLLCSSVFCYIGCVKKNSNLTCPTIDDFREYLESENITIDSENIFDKEYLLFNKPCKVLSLDSDTPVKDKQAHILFATPDGFFITDTQDDCKNKEIEIDGETVGFAYKGTPLGLVNVFYEDFDLTTSEKIKLMPECEISEGDAELYNNGKRIKINLTVDPQKAKAFLSEDDCSIQNLVGSVVVQNGKLAAIVTAFDEERGMLICESAEKCAKGLNKAAYEHKMFGFANGFAEFLKKRKNKKD